MLLTLTQAISTAHGSAFSWAMFLLARPDVATVSSSLLKELARCEAAYAQAPAWSQSMGPVQWARVKRPRAIRWRAAA